MAAASWILVLICMGCILSTYSVDLRKLNRRQNRRRNESDLLIQQLDDLTRKYSALEQSFQQLLKSNAALRATVIGQTERVDQLHSTAKRLPIIATDVENLKTRAGKMEEKVNEISGERFLQFPRSSGVASIDSVNGDIAIEDWINSVSRDDILDLIKSFAKNDLFIEKRLSLESEEGKEETLEEETMATIGKALVKLVTEEKTDSTSKGNTDVRYDIVQSSSDDNNRTEQQVVTSEHPRPRGIFLRAIAEHIRESRSAVYRDDTPMGITRITRGTTKKSKGKKVAFSLIRTTPLLGNASGPQVVTFDQDLVRKGKGLDKAEGVFTCATQGIYYFSYNMRTYDHKHLGVALMLNDEPVVGMTADASDRKVMQSQSAMLSLKVGDQVWLMLGPSEDFALYGNDFNYCTFNGMLLYPGK
ncbi:uncharacterized protein LOC102809593 [Saccoglossus kowalevskii]|uniref:Uncharacterized protein LOC102809593 n=1 Tax=Saccoglossus kowalevskii TaxID=10224 RepID=A0ABM0N0U2_SACKO|nr:PREDICTED: uncharacterized protein LOC102809593 [Saccoglossus kowalevskii]